MDRKSIILHEIDPGFIEQKFERLESQIQEIKLHFEPKQPVEFLTRKQVAQLLHCDQSSVHNWTRKGKLKAYGIGNRVYFKRSEVESAMIPLGPID